MTKVMGVVDVTSDSFSDGEVLVEPDEAVARARRLVTEGADIVGIGGRRTRPGAAPVPDDVELGRLLPVIDALAGTLGTAEIGVETASASVAEAALAAGATILNDMSASLEDVAAAHGAGWVAMRAPSPNAPGSDDRRRDIVEEVAEFLHAAAARGRRSGVGRIWVDPGVDVAESIDQALELAANLDRFARSAAVVVGVDRSRSAGWLHAEFGGTRRVAAATPPVDRLEGSLALATWSAHLGVDIVRVHDVRATVHAVRVVRP